MPIDLVNTTGMSHLKIRYSEVEVINTNLLIFAIKE